MLIILFLTNGAYAHNPSEGKLHHPWSALRMSFGTIFEIKFKKGI